LCLEANSARNCVGLITWMHTFSPAKMWIAGLTALQKPFAHLHTQYNRDIPWSEIDMDKTKKKRENEKNKKKKRKRKQDSQKKTTI